MYVQCNIEARSKNEFLVEKEKYYIFLRVCVCVRVLSGGARARAYILTYPALNMHAPYCLLSVWLHYNFRHYFLNDTIFGKKSLSKNMFFISSTTFT